MANLFDAQNAPSSEPVEIVAGDFAQWKRSDIATHYPTSTGFTAEYVFRVEGGLSEFKVAQSASSTDDYYLFVISSADSSSFSAGTYKWQLEITETSSSNRIAVESGEMKVIADMDVSGADSRGHAQVMVQKIESLLSGKADSDVSSYAIAGRSLTKLSFSELIEARDYYRREAIKEGNDDLIRRGKTGRSTIKVRF